MALFKKKSRMIDMTKSSGGVVRLPKEPINIPTQDSDGFVNLAGSSTPSSTSTSTESSSSSSEPNFFGFMDDSNPSTSEGDNYTKREVDAKITSLDNKIYKLEQRIELLEKKLDINKPDDNLGPMGW